MEIKEIYDCQEVLEFAIGIKTEEERKCDQLFKNPDTIIWLKERGNFLNDKIRAISNILNQKQEDEKDEINRVLIKKTSELRDIKILDSDKHFNEKLQRDINDSERKIKEYDRDIHDIEQSKSKLAEEIKNKESNEKYWREQVNDARRAVTSAETDLTLSKQRESDNSCWRGYSPELIHSCVRNYQNKLEQIKEKWNNYESNLISATVDLKTVKEKNEKFSQDIELLNIKKYQEVFKRNQYIKDKEETEKKTQKIQDQKKSLNTDIKNQKAEQIKINEELINLQEHLNNFDRDLYEEQKIRFEKEFQMIDSLEQKIMEYQDVTTKDYQYQEL